MIDKMKTFLAKRWQGEETNPMMTVMEKAHDYPDIINLSIGDPDLKAPQEILQRAFEDISNGHTKYSDPWGYPELRDAIVQFYKEDYNIKILRENVLIMPAGCPAMFLVLQAVLDKDDEVLVFDPYFAAYDQQVRIPGGVPVFVPCYEEENWQPNMQRAEKLITHKTKAMIINTPNNPTGVCYSDETLQEIARFAKKHDLLVLADDIYTSFCYGHAFTPITSLPDMAQRTVIINSFSKNFMITGLRIGNIVAPKEIAKAVKRINDNVVYCAPVFGQRAAIYALEKRHTYEKMIVPEFEKRMQYAAQRIRAIKGFTLSPASGGIYLFPGIKQTGMTSMQAAQMLLEQAHVLTLPGSAFGEAGEGYLRIACTVGLEQLEQAFDRIERIFEK